MILGIESSCDESALALFAPGRGVLGEWVYSQVALHGKYGGIVPDLASREHLRRFGPLLTVLEREHDLAAVTQIAVTRGPGLAGCLALGIALAKALSLSLGVPCLAGNHLRGHAFSPFIALHGEAPETFDAAFADLLPHLGLIVSGGNTLLCEIAEDRSLTVLTATVDDAAGEALDKGAKLLGMPYPGGPLVEKAAAGGDAKRFDFPKGIVDPADARFSFSGLKTSLRYTLEKMSKAEVGAAMADLCASYQAAVIAQLVLKTRHALRDGRFRSLGLSGGVANNHSLRAAFVDLGARSGLPVVIAEPRHTGDNATMIAFSAWADPATEAHAAGRGLDLDPSLGL